MWKHSMEQFSDEYLLNALSAMENDLKELFTSYIYTEVLNKKIKQVKEELKKRGYKGVN